jgi:hypothetical protein
MRVNSTDAVSEEQPVARQLVGIAAGHQVEQGTTVGQPVQGGGLARRHGGRNDARTQGDEELQTLGDRNQRRRHQPGVFARTPGGDQYAAVAQAIGCLSDLLQVTVVDRPCTFGGAQVMAVAVGGKKPENIEAHGVVS